MAAAELTPRQKQIKALKDEGKTAKQIAKKLKITENAVYQQLRRIKAGGGGAAKKSGGSKATGQKAASGGRKSGGSARQRQAPVAVKPQTAQEILKAEVEETTAAIKAQQDRVVEAEATITEANAKVEELKVELARREDTLAVLTGEKRAQAIPQPKPAAAKTGSAAKSGGRQSGSKGGSKGDSGSQDGAQATSNGNGSTAPAPAADAAPSADEPTTQAEREATAEHDGTPGEQPAPTPAAS